jgi:hypothetical protein
MYSKVFAQIFNSSIAEDHVVRHVFMDLLVLADRWGEVDMTLNAISRTTNVPVDIVEHAIGVLMRPDPTSRSGRNDGKRLILLDDHRDWGWQIVNFETYNRMQSEDGRKTYFREYRAKKRAEKRAEKNAQVEQNKSETCEHGVQDSSICSQCSRTHLNTDVNTNKYLKTTHPAPSGHPSRNAGGNPTEPRLRIVRGVEPIHLEAVRGLILRFWREMNATECPWGAKDEAALGKMLRDSPGVAVEAWDKMLDNRAWSIRAGEYSSSQMPCAWLKKLRSFESEPLNKHGDPLRNSRPDAMVGVMRK